MSKNKILLVDDDAKLTHLLAVILTRVGGYEALEENRAFAAVAVAQEFRPNLILLDVDMPGKDGGAIAYELSRDPHLAATPIIFVSSLIGAAEQGVRDGMEYMSKPVDTQHLLNTVRRLCQPRALPLCA